MLPFGALSLGDTTILALTDVTDGLPMLVGSDRHVSMDAVSVAGHQSAPDSLSLDLAGFCGLTVRYTLFPGSLRGELARVQGAEASLIRGEALWTLTVRFTGEAARILLK